MSIDIKLAVTGRHARPVTKGTLAGDAFYTLLNLFMGLIFVPRVVDNGIIAGILVALFTIMATLQAIDLGIHTRQFRAQRRAAA